MTAPSSPAHPSPGPLPEGAVASGSLARETASAGDILRKGLIYVPGVLLLLAVGYLGKVVAEYVPHTAYVIWAIAIGMVIRNTIPIPKVFLPGIGSYELWLKTGIVLMGAKFAFQNILAVGGTGLAMVVLEIALSIVVAAYLARKFGLSDKLGSLIGVGVGICGVSAVIGATGAIKARQEDASYAIATILIFGAVMVFLYPFIGRIVGMSDIHFGYWAGLAVDNTAECLATGFAYSEGAGRVATVVKLCRNALMGLVILFMALTYARRGMTAEVTDKARFLWDRFPKFVLGFLALSLAATFGLLAQESVKAMADFSKWLFLLTFAGVGLSTEFSRMKAGLKPFAVGFVVEALVSVMTIGMIYLVIT
ncbi:MAG TPA: putative sulfate exporter family transporter [Clostridiales bacterium]|nr:putative sulfate exporter family transporter [Clostridiales bacterium]